MGNFGHFIAETIHGIVDNVVDAAPPSHFSCFFLDRMESLDHKLTDVGEGQSVTNRDAVLGGEGEEFAEGAVDGEGGAEVAQRAEDFLGDDFRVVKLEFLKGVLGAEGRVVRSKRHLAAAAVGGAIGTASLFIYFGLMRHGSFPCGEGTPPPPFFVSDRRYR